MEGPLLQFLSDLPPTFGSQFLRDHAGQLISEPRIAVVELIANSYDAGATDVRVVWPDETGELFQVEDNGTGMTPDEFQRRWRQLSYNRSQEQGTVVQFPPGVRNKKERIAFGMSGKGRHSAFCFADSYEVETWRDGHSITVRVVLTNGGDQPFRCSVTGEGRKAGHGTKVSVRVERQLSSVDQIREWIGSKFIVDPSFKISINGHRVFLTDLQSLSSQEVDIASHGTWWFTKLTLTKQIARRACAESLGGLIEGWWANHRGTVLTIVVLFRMVEQQLQDVTVLWSKRTS